MATNERTVRAARKRRAAARGAPAVAGAGAPLLRDAAYATMRDAIRSGEYAPGTPISESVLSAELGISRTPVREALRQLVQEGLVSVLPNRCGVVAAPSLGEVLNVLHLRAMLEPEMARLVTERASERTVGILRGCVERMAAAARADERDEWRRADDDLHETLTEFCPNVLLSQLALQMRNRMQLVATDAHTTTARLVACTEEHRAVVEAVAAGDGEGARAAMERHLRNLRESLFKRLG